MESSGMEWFVPYYRSIPFFKGEIDDRFAAQFYKQIIDLGLDPYFFVDILYGDKGEFFYQVVETLSKLPVFCEQFFPTRVEKELRKKEWEEDEVSFNTALKLKEKGKLKRPARTLFGYEGQYAKQWEKIEEFEKKGGHADMCESLSLEEQYHFFEEF